MEEINGRFTMLVGQDMTRIEIMDSISSTVFCRIELTPEQLSAVLSRLANVECKITVHALDRIGKTMEHKMHAFEIPDDFTRSHDKPLLTQLCAETIPEGWLSDDSYNSQNTFFEKDGKRHAQTIIRRWV